MLVRSPEGEYDCIDFRETAPAAAFQDMYKNNVNASIYGGLASGVPGELRGLSYLHDRYGKLPWKTVVAPAVNVSRFGFPVSQDLNNFMDGVTPVHGPGFLVDDPNWAIDFAPNGTRLGTGDILTRKRYADTLEVIGERGVDAFYKGPIAQATIDAIQSHNGTMTLQDLANYTVALRDPVNITYRDYRLTACGAPAGGSVSLSALKIFEGYANVATESVLNISTHRLDESIRFAYGERTNLGDPSFVTNLTTYQQEMLLPETAKLIRAKISDAHTLNVSAYNPDGIESLETPGTSHVVTSDHSGLSVSLTTTINLIFGSQVMVPETGIILNDEMNDFSIPGVSNQFGYAPSPSNYIRPGKRPLSSISPVIADHLSNSSLYLVIGAAGGSRIITSTIQNIWHILDQGEDLHDALAEPRLHDQLIPNQVTFEYAYDNRTVAFMEGRGHNVTWIAPGQSSAQALRLHPNGTFEVAGEPRQMASGGFAV